LKDKNGQKKKLFFHSFIIHIGCDNNSIIVITFNS
jgi:hypothetical protein